MRDVAVMVLGCLLALAVVGWTLAGHRLALAERGSKVRASVARALASLLPPRP